MKRRAASLLGSKLRQAVSHEPMAVPTGGLFGTGSRLALPGANVNSAISNQVRGAALPAQQVATKLRPDALPLTRTDEVGAVSIVEPYELGVLPTVFENVDGKRIEDGRYAAFIKDISGEWLPAPRKAGACRPALQLPDCAAPCRGLRRVHSQGGAPVH